jgi:hypothetical protein
MTTLLSKAAPRRTGNYCEGGYTAVYSSVNKFAQVFLKTINQWVFTAVDSVFVHV